MLIGGGDNGHGTTTYETKEIDEEIVKMTNKNSPTFLFIGLASSFSDSYYDIMKEIYKNLGCKTTYLKKKNIINNPDIVKNKITEADIIYMSGGDTKKLVDTLKEYKIDELIKEAQNRGCVIAGISAGAIAIADSGLSDYQILNNISNKYAFTKGLKLININICPHANKKERIDDLKELLKENNQEVICLENGTALKIENNTIEIIYSLNNKVKLINNNKEITLDNINIKKIINL
jgi:dipeptidase E